MFFCIRKKTKKIQKSIFRGPQARVGGMSTWSVGGWYFNDSCAPMLLNVWREHIFEKSGIAPAVRKGEYKGVGPFCFGHVYMAKAEGCIMTLSWCSCTKA